MLVSYFGGECDGDDADKNGVWLLVLYLRKKVMFIPFNADKRDALKILRPHRIARFHEAPFSRLD